MATITSVWLQSMKHKENTSRMIHRADGILFHHRLQRLDILQQTPKGKQTPPLSKFYLKNENGRTLTLSRRQARNDTQLQCETLGG